MVTVSKGLWQSKGTLEVVLKPGGHGVMWKLARDEGVLDWFREKGRTATLVRQISNPMAGTDSTLLALAGMGQKMNKVRSPGGCEESAPRARPRDRGVVHRGRCDPTRHHPPYTLPNCDM